MKFISFPKDYRRVSGNFFSLAFFQATNLILPFVTLPYLIKTLGHQKFGLLAISQALLSYFIMLVDYSFGQTATQAISVNRDDAVKINSIYNTVFQTRAALCVLGFVVYSALVLLIPTFRVDWKFFIVSYVIVLGHSLTPAWFFQGIEKMKYITYLNFFTKILYTASIFIFVKNQSQHLLVNFILGISNAAAGIAGVLMIHTFFGTTIKSIDSKGVLNQLKEGWPLFVSNLAINVYTYSNTIILGFFSSKLIVGYYSVAEKTIFAIRQLIVVFSHSIYPYACVIAAKGADNLKQFFRNFFIPFALLIFLLCAFAFVFSDTITILLNKKYVEEVSVLIKILAAAPLIATFNIPAYLILLVYNFKSSYTTVLITGTAVFLAVSLLSSSLFSAYGTAGAVLFTEAFITIGLNLILIKRHPKYALI
jgi:PST family polysaccharide transporter